VVLRFLFTSQTDTTIRTFVWLGGDARWLCLLLLRSIPYWRVIVIEPLAFARNPFTIMIMHAIL
jgi:hypothetical protein